MKRSALLICVAVLLVLIWDSSYVGRRDVARAITSSQRQACRNGLRGRRADAEAWYSAYLARRDQANRTRDPRLRAQYWASAQAYLASARTLNSLLDVAHSVTWPAASRNHPLGLGQLDCAAEYPTPAVNWLQLGS